MRYMNILFLKYHKYHYFQHAFYFSPIILVKKEDENFV